jgi:hypothetical protein
MPTYPRDDKLFSTVKALVEGCENNQSAVARKLNTSRLRIHRVLAQEGRVTEAVRRDLWSRIRAAQGQHDAGLGGGEPDVVIQERVLVANLAKQVIQLIADAVERVHPTGDNDAVRH